MQQPRLIAIVEDNQLVASSIESLLRSAGLPAAIFPGGTSFLRFDKIAEIGCVLTDLNMPDMNGLELQAALNAQDRRIPIIFMTAFPTEEARKRALLGGALAFMTKPIAPDDLIETIRMALDGRPTGA